jgi:4-hydroxyacetophenone monooxygenase
MPMTITGRNGVNLHDQWDGDARAYLGIVAPNFPNFFFLYGPNTNIVINGSIIYFSECEVHYTTQCLKYMFEKQLNSIDVKPEVHDEYNEWIDQGNRRMAWGLSDVSSWYKNASGRTAQNWPFSLLEYWEQTREIKTSDYKIT